MTIAERPAGATQGAERTRPWRDAREWMERVERLGELEVVRGANWQEDMGAITQMLDRTEGAPCVVFDDVPGYPSGFRVLVNTNGTPGRQAVTLSLPQSAASHQGLLDYWRGALASFQSLPPRVVESGPVFENVLTGDGVDLFKFPTPKWHTLDGGRFMGTASLNILGDPDSDWVNVGTYRNQIFDARSLGLWISPGKHGKLIREKYFDRGQRCPIVVVVGADPLLFMAACVEGLDYGLSELAWAGGIRGEAIDVVRGPVTGLPIPATAEIAIEGWLEPGEEHTEGPYGEWMGYYASGSKTTPVIRAEAIYHRNDPILLGCPQGKPPHEDNRFLAYLKSAMVEEQLRRAGVPKVTGVWLPPLAGNRLMTIVAVEQAYPGHAMQAALIAGQTGTSAYAGRYVVVVDEDIDVYNMNDVLWAMMTRCDPKRDFTIIKHAWSGPLDPAIHPDHRGYNSRVIVDATKPWDWKELFAEPVVTADMARATREQWGWILDPNAADPRSGGSKGEGLAR